ncbi:hypothetical protein D3C84_861510 [compost metagenome]
MLEQRLSCCFFGLNMPSIVYTKRLPEQAANTAVAVAPSHFSSMGQLFYRVLVHTFMTNRLRNLCNSRVDLGLTFA